MVTFTFFRKLRSFINNLTTYIIWIQYLSKNIIETNCNSYRSYQRILLNNKAFN